MDVRSAYPNLDPTFLDALFKRLEADGQFNQVDMAYYWDFVDASDSCMRTTILSLLKDMDVPKLIEKGNIIEVIGTALELVAYGITVFDFKNQAYFQKPVGEMPDEVVRKAIKKKIRDLEPIMLEVIQYSLESKNPN